MTARRARMAVNGSGAVLTAAAAIVITATKFEHGAWLIVVIVPLLVVLFAKISATYDRIGRQIGVQTLPERPKQRETIVVVPVVAITRLTSEILSAAMSMGDRIVAVHVYFPDEEAEARAMRQQWKQWRPEVPLQLHCSRDRELGPPLAAFIARLEVSRVVVVIGELAPVRRWERLLKNWRGAVIARYLSRNASAVVCRLRMPLAPQEPTIPISPAAATEQILGS